MLKPASAFDTTTQLGMVIHNHVAIDPDTGAHLSSSRGRQRSGAGHRYVVVIPTCNFWLTQSGNVYYDNLYLHFRAFNDNEAIEKGNQRLAKQKPAALAARVAA